MKKKERSSRTPWHLILAAILLFCFLFLDDIIIISTVLFNPGENAVSGAAFPFFITCILVYIVVFLALPAIFSAVLSGTVILRSVLDRNGKSAGIFGIITVIELGIVFLLYLISNYLVGKIT